MLAVDDVAPGPRRAAPPAVARRPASRRSRRRPTRSPPCGCSRRRRFDAVFLDIAMPGMDGMELAALLGRMTEPPAIVFVTAFEQHAAAAYQVGAVDYLLKPISAERLAAALDRVRRVRRARAGRRRPPVDELAAVPVELGGRTRFVRRDDVRFAEAQGDYVRLHTREGTPPAAHPDLAAGGALARRRVPARAPRLPARRGARAGAAQRRQRRAARAHRRRRRARSAAATPASCATACSTPRRAACSSERRRS